MKFQGVFRKTNPAGDNIVFEKIWSNTNFRANLFPEITDFTASDAEARGLALFTNKISLTSNSFYNFIKVK